MLEVARFTYWTVRPRWIKCSLRWRGWESKAGLSSSSGTGERRGPGSHRRGALAGVTVGQQLIHGDPEGPDVGCIVELTLLQALWGIPGGMGHSGLGPDQVRVLTWGLGALWSHLGPHPGPSFTATRPCHLRPQHLSPAPCLLQVTLTPHSSWSRLVTRIRGCPHLRARSSSHGLQAQPWPGQSPRF